MRQLIKKMVPNRMLILARYPAEQLIYWGYDWKPRSKDKSVLFFTVHKSASTYMNKFFSYVNQKYLHLRKLDMEGVIFQSNNHRVTDYLWAHRARFFKPQGFCYAPLRDYLQLENLKEYRIVVMVRDPRDLLVSLFYSNAYSHGLPYDMNRKREWISRRNRALQTGLEAQVLEYLPEFKERYLNYWQHLIKGMGAPLLRYETMVLDFDSWLSRMQDALELKFRPEDAEALKKIGGFGRSRPENQYAHIRKVTPGDHREKLRPEFIRLINEPLREVLDLYQYDVT